MNVVPIEFIRVMPDALKGLVSTIFEKVGMPETDASLITDLLVATDLRGVFSHGTQQTAGYARAILTGKVNPRPAIRLVEESPTTAVFDGDGGMGHFPSYRAAVWVTEKAKAVGLGAATTRNHFHFGAAGKYSRIPMTHDCIGMAFSAHRTDRNRKGPVYGAGGGSPMSVAIPAGKEPPIVIDMATSFHPDNHEHFNSIFSKMPSAFFKSLGLGTVAQALGGYLAGIWRFVGPPPGIYEYTNQGAFILAIDIARFLPIEEFKREIDAYISSARKMTPFPGYDRADLPGGLEAEREQQWATEGIPVGRRHQESLEGIAAEVGLPVPW
jgi:LDH2 family malate/lactate/ureidoglycolate dehydrogenase